jgi:hypothetical protein
MRRQFISRVAVVAVLAMSGAVSAAVKKTESPYAAQVRELHEIKVLLETANHDYKGHRAEAVKHITHAIHALEAGHQHHPGPRVKGSGEPQQLSDAQLRESVKALHSVHTQLSTAATAPATKGADHVHHAIKQLETALKIK